MHRIFRHPRHTLRTLLSSQRGATAVEYGLITAIIVLGLINAMQLMGSKSGGMWNNVATEVTKY